MRRTSVQIALPLLGCLMLSIHCGAQSYSQVAVSGAQDNDEGPKIFKALNMDLVFPQTFNATMPATASTTTTAPATTKDYAALRQEATRKPTIFVTPPSYVNTEQQQQQQQQPQQQVEQQRSTMYESPQKSQQQQRQREQSMHLREEAEQQQRLAQQYAQQQQQYASTGRAIDYSSSPYQQFGQFMKPLMQNVARPAYATARPLLNHRAQYTRPAPASAAGSQLSKLIYPQRYAGNRPRAPNAYVNPVQITDRFNPGEATASVLFKNRARQKAKVPAATSIVQSYASPTDTYSFPPNLHAKYPSPSQDPKATVPNGKINSYVAPASGPLVNSGDYPLVAASSSNQGYNYKGPITTDYLPPTGGDDSKDAVKDAGGDGGDNMIGVLPASAMDAAGDGDTKGAMPTDDHDHDHHHDHDHDHDHHHDHSLTGYDTGVEYPTPPPGWLEAHPEATESAPPKDGDSMSDTNDMSDMGDMGGMGDDHKTDDSMPPADDHPPTIEHDHHEHHFDFPTDTHDFSFPSYPDDIYSHHHHHHHPEIIYDDHPHHHQYHPPPPPPPLPSTEPPPPPEEPTEEPRVKKYSYFYIGRKLWYIPLYFTVWFSFYILWLILKSIARHKVDLPNHYVSRRSLHDFQDSNAEEYINQLTVKVLEQIDGFKRKYIT